MARRMTSDGIRRAIETCESYQRGANLSDVKVTNLRIGKATVSADVSVVDSDERTRKHRGRYDIFSL
jgi:hypothetical protein